MVTMKQEKWTTNPRLMSKTVLLYELLETEKRKEVFGSKWVMRLLKDI